MSSRERGGRGDKGGRSERARGQGCSTGRGGVEASKEGVSGIKYISGRRMIRPASEVREY